MYLSVYVYLVFSSTTEFKRICDFVIGKGPSNVLTQVLDLSNMFLNM